MSKRSVKYLSSKVDKLKFKQIIIILLGAIVSALSVAFAFLIEGLILAVSTGSGVTFAIINTIVVIAFIFILTALTNFLSEKFKIEAETAIKKHVVKGYVEKSYNQGEIATGDVVTRVESEAVAFSTSVMTVVPKILTAVIKLLMILGAVYAVNALFGLIVTIAGVVIVGVTFLIRRVTVKLYKKTLEENAKVSSYLTEVDENLLAVKGLRAENAVTNTFDGKLTPYGKAKKNQRYFQAGFSSLIPFAFNLTFLIAVILSKEYIFGVVAIVQLIMQARTPITSFAGYISSYYEMGVSAKRLIEITGDSENFTVASGEFEKLVVDDVSFSYENEPILNNLSFTVNKGEKVIIKGKTGVGKTTLLKLLTGVYKLSVGSVKYYFNGNSYDAFNVKNAFSVAYQGNMIFSGTLKDNITLSNLNATNEDIENAINFSVLTDVVNAVGGLDGVISERGANLSEGQRQRLAIARAILSNASVIILDEPTSALDDDTKTELLENIKNSNKTFIIVSHDEKVFGVGGAIIDIG